MDKIDTWIKDRFGTTNTFNRQLLDNFIEFLEKEWGCVIKDPDQSLPKNPHPFLMSEGANTTDHINHIAHEQAQKQMRDKEHWVKVKEKS